MTSLDRIIQSHREEKSEADKKIECPKCHQIVESRDMNPYYGICNECVNGKIR